MKPQKCPTTVAQNELHKNIKYIISRLYMQAANDRLMIASTMPQQKVLINVSSNNIIPIISFSLYFSFLVQPSVFVLKNNMCVHFFFSRN